MATMRAVQVSRPGGQFELVERAVPDPGPGQVRIRVEACGVCHSDSFVKEGAFPGIAYPRVPGHEVAGRVDAVGAGVTAWKEGQRVGVGWHGGHCFACDRCRRGDFITCRQARITGLSHDGGYADYMVSPQEALARIPDALESAAAAPLLCAGITTFNSLRHSGAGPGDLVAIHGLGGLGHLAVQFASLMGFRTVAMSRGRDKEELARKLGADAYIDTTAGDAAEQLGRMGGARVILATAPNSQEMSALVDGLDADGVLLVVAAGAEPVVARPAQLIRGRRSIRGWPSGDAAASEDTLRFCALEGARPMVEGFPLERASEAYERMMASKVRFRSVLEIA